MMNIHLRVNGRDYSLEVTPRTTLLKALRDLGFTSVRYGCDEGACGACTVLLDGQPAASCLMLAAQAEGHDITTIEALGEHPEQGWKDTQGLHVIQQAFVETGAIQSGYNTPGTILLAKHLLERNPNPTEEEVREALSGVLVRDTGGVKPVQAVLLAAARLRGEAQETVPEVWERTVRKVAETTPEPGADEAERVGPVLTSEERETLQGQVFPKMYLVPQVPAYRRVGRPEPKADAVKLALGNPAFTADIQLPGMLVAKVLRSPVAHARIKRIDVSKAKALPGVHAVLTWKDLPRVPHSTAGQSYPIPGPQDTFSLDNKVRFVGDRVAFVAAESEEIAEEALRLIEVEYEPLPAVFDPREALKEGAPVIHDEEDYIGFGDSDPQRNLAAKIRIDLGDVEKGLEEADYIFEAEYETPKVQHAHVEPHVTVTYWDEDGRLVIRTSTQVPFHVRRMLADVLQLPVKRIRVVKPRLGDGYGGKQEILTEDVAAHLTIATGRPVLYMMTREEQFLEARSRHRMIIRIKTGVKKDGTLTANAMYLISDTGAYGGHALTVAGNVGHKPLALYPGDGKYREDPNIRFYADVAYTNRVPAGAYRGYGATQGAWAVERHMDKIARSLGMDPLEFRLKNALRPGELHPFSRAWSEGRDPRPEVIETNGLAECVRVGRETIGWDEKYGNPEWHQVPGKPHLRRGIGAAFIMQGTAIPYLDMGGAFIKMNDDGSFNLMVGGADIGTGADTVIAQMVAEVLGVPVEDIIVHSGDTDFTPFDKGAYASSTTYISGGAAVRAAEVVAERIRIRAARLLNQRGDGPEVRPEDIQLADRKAMAPDGRAVTFAESALNALHLEDHEQIMGSASMWTPKSPPPFGVQFAEVVVDTETGQVTVERILTVLDSGVIINPLGASGQVEGAVQHSLGFALCEELTVDEAGRPLQRSFRDYHVFQTNEMPRVETIFVETFEPSHPFGVKSVSEIPMNGIAPAIANAVYDAVGVDIDANPLTPEKVWRALRAEAS